MPNYVLAHDLGTTGNKATLYDREGCLTGSAFYAYETEYAHTGWAEQNPEDWWQAVCATMNDIAETIQPDPAAQAAYEKVYRLFEAAYQALVPVYGMMGSVGS